MSFIIKPINAVLQKDFDTFTKMDPYVKLTIGSLKYRSKTHKSGGKHPFWGDVFQVPVNALPKNLLMKVQLYDEDLLKDDFLGDGCFDLSQLLKMPGNVEQRYIDLVRKGSKCGRLLLQMVYNGPPMGMNQGAYYNKNIQNVPTNPYYSGKNFIPQNNPGLNPESSGWNVGPSHNQGSIKPKQGDLWNEVKPVIGGGLVVQNNFVKLCNEQQPGYNNANSGWNKPSGNQKNSGW